MQLHVSAYQNSPNLKSNSFPVWKASQKKEKKRKGAFPYSFNFLVKLYFFQIPEIKLMRADIILRSGQNDPLVFLPGESHRQRSLAGYSP